MKATQMTGHKATDKAARKYSGAFAQKGARIIIVALLALAAGIQSTGAQTLEAKIDQYLSEMQETGRFSGAALVAKKGQIVLEKAYGMANEEWSIPNTVQTKFRIGSLTKAFTAMGIMMLQEEKKLTVSDPISTWFPDFPNSDKITIRHLLTHSSGIPDFLTSSFYRIGVRSPVTPMELVERVKDVPLFFAPGTKGSYSNTNYVMLGYIIERVSRRPYYMFLKERIFEPLNMKDSAYSLSEPIVPKRAAGYVYSASGKKNCGFIDISGAYAAGGIHSTLEDMYKWDRALYTDALISKESREEMFTPFLASYAYGWIVSPMNNHKVIWHTGQIHGFSSLIERYVDDDVCVIILSNIENTGISPQSMPIYLE